MNIKELWKEAGGTFETGNQHDWPHARIDSPAAFAELVAAHEREECAKMLDNWYVDEDFVDNIADAIRARSKA